MATIYIKFIAIEKLSPLFRYKTEAVELAANAGDQC